MAEWGLGFDDKSEDPFGGGGASIAMRDMLFSSVAGITALVVVLLAVLVLVNALRQQEVKAVGIFPGPIVAQMRCDIKDPRTGDIADLDCDIWATYLGDEGVGGEKKAVGYSNRVAGAKERGGSAAGYAYSYDDLGCMRDPDTTKCIPFKDPKNYELAFARLPSKGIHCFNGHLYRNGSGLQKIPMQLTVHVAKTNAGEVPLESPVKVIDVTEMMWQGREYNFGCIVIDDKGDVVRTYRSDTVCLRSVDGFNAAIGACN